MSDAEIFEQFETVKYLYLREISEPDKNAFNTLAIVAEEAILNQSKAATLRPELAHLKSLLQDAHPIESVEGCRAFRLYWRNYIAYMVTEEMAGSTGPIGGAEECYTGKLFRKYSKSHFLDYIEHNTGGRTRDPQHYRLVCLDHIIDIASCFPPEISVVERQ